MTDELAARREAHHHAQRPPTVLLVEAGAPRAAAFKAWAASNGGVRLFVAPTSSAAFAIATREQPEVAVVDLMFRDGRAVALALELRSLAPDLEVVFVVDDSGAPEAQAAWDLGWQRLVDPDSIEGWLERGLKPLATLVRLKRQVTLARHEAERLSAGTVVPTVAPLPLAVAERRYRETFLRSKLAMAGERREAARLAGVPYTTFCVMLRKLGIKR
jgi:CheY-like chemotaxis protein